MRRLSFKKVFIDPITEGRKVSTLRLSTPLEPGDRVALTCQWGQPPFAYADVTLVRSLPLWKLTEDIAQAEGFESVVDLVKTLSRLYPGKVDFVQVVFALEAVVGDDGHVDPVPHGDVAEASRS